MASIGDHELAETRQAWNNEAPTPIDALGFRVPQRTHEAVLPEYPHDL